MSSRTVSALLAAAEGAGLTPVGEAFADRAYTPQGLLVSRREAGAVLHDPDEIAQRCVRLVTEGVVTAIDGSDVAVPAESICVHGDTAGAVEIAQAVRDALVAAGVTPTAFVPDGVAPGAAAPAATAAAPTAGPVG